MNFGVIIEAILAEPASEEEDGQAPNRTLNIHLHLEHNEDQLYDITLTAKGLLQRHALKAIEVDDVSLLL